MTAGGPFPVVALVRPALSTVEIPQWPMTCTGEFQWRGMVYAGTEGVHEVLARDKVTAYIGFDPTASSLHVGSLLPLMALARLQRFGHAPIAIAGGGTGMIGDPSGKTQERQLLTLEQIEENLVGIRRQLEKFLDFHAPSNPARIVNNADWLAKLDLMSFLRDIGKHFTVNAMLARESVKRRIESEDGISYTEFTYSLLQAFDFLTLFDRYRCTLQLGGSDQWGNIVSGADLIRKLRGGKAHGLVMPLVTTASGVKFGKTEAGTVWLDGARTSPFRFYQFWLNTVDADVARYLKYFTFLGQEEIGELERSLQAAPERRASQRALAREVTGLVHGQDAVDRVERASAVLFSEAISELRADEVLAVFEDVPSTDVPAASLEGDGASLAELLATSRLASVQGRGGAAHQRRGHLRQQSPRQQRARARAAPAGDRREAVRAAEGQAAAARTAGRRDIAGVAGEEGERGFSGRAVSVELDVAGSPPYIHKPAPGTGRDLTGSNGSTVYTSGRRENGREREGRREGLTRASGRRILSFCLGGDPPESRWMTAPEHRSICCLCPLRPSDFSTAFRRGESGG